MWQNVYDKSHNNIACLKYIFFKYPSRLLFQFNSPVRHIHQSFGEYVGSNICLYLGGGGGETGSMYVQS